MSHELEPSTRFAPRVVGVVHLLPLPGSVRGGPAATLPAVLDAARRDATAYAEGGAEAIIVENFGDNPFRQGAVDQHVIAAMTLAVAAVHEECGLPVGVNVLRNDVVGAVGIAAMTGSRFVRANIYVGAAVTDQGVIEGEAERVQLLIKRLGTAIDVWADVDVKHATHIAPRPLADQAEDAVDRGLASAVIVTGRATGRSAAVDDLISARKAVPRALVYVGSGVTAESAARLLSHADGVIVGTAAKVDGIATNAVDPGRVAALVQAARLP